MMLAWGFVGGEVRFGSVQDEGRQVDCNEAVEANNGGLFGFEGENDVPNGCCVECCKASAKASRGPVKNRDCDDIRQPSQSAKPQTSVFVKFSIMYACWDGTGSRGGGCKAGELEAVSC